MTKQYPTKQYLSEVISNREFAESVPPEIVIVMARQLLAGMEQEPVAWPNHCDSTIPAALRFLAEKPRPIYGNSPYNTEHLYQLAREIEAMARRPLYAAPQLPQPAVTITQHFDTIALDTAKEVMCDVSRRHEFLGGDVQLLSRIQCRIDEACRAAMLQGKE